MAEKTLNTRLILRNDTLVKWEASTKPLFKGEAALALRTDGNYEVRIGAADSLSTWSMLSSSGQLVVPVKNIDNLKYTEYQLSDLEVGSGETKKFQLAGLRRDTEAWELIGDDPIVIPEVDFTPINAKIDYLSNEVSTITETTLPNLKTELSATLSAYADEQAAAAKAAGELSAQAVRNSLESDYVKHSDVKDWSAELITDTNKIVTEKDIAELTGVMHFVGATTDLNLVNGYTGKPTGLDYTESLNPKKGDFAIRSDTGKEFVFTGVFGEGGKWVEIGDETLYATKEELGDEEDARIANDTYLSSAISATIKVGNYGEELESRSDLSVVKIDGDIYHELVAKGKYNPKVLYVVSSDYLNAYNKQILNVGTPLAATDAVNLSSMTDAISTSAAETKSEVLATQISSIAINGQDFTIVGRDATITLSTIDCGGAE